jgi:hypothetical protein
MRSLLPGRYHGAFANHFVASGDAGTPMSRVMLSTVDPRLPMLEDEQILRYVWEIEGGLPDYRNSTLDYLAINDRVVPVRADSPRLVPNRASYLAHLEDLAFYFSDPDNRRRLATLRGEIREAVQWGKRKQPERLVSALRNMLRRRFEDPLAEARVRDIVDQFLPLVSVRELGLVPERGRRAYRSSTSDQLRLRFPDWRALLEHPELNIAARVRAGEFAALACLADAVADLRVKCALCDALVTARQPAAFEVYRAVIERDDDTRYEMAAALRNSPHRDLHRTACRRVRRWAAKGKR